MLSDWLEEAAMWLLGLTQESPCLHVGNMLFSERGGGAGNTQRDPMGVRDPGGQCFGHERDLAASGDFSPCSHLPEL